MNFLFSSYSFNVSSSIVFLNETLSKDQKPQGCRAFIEADLVAL
jgi:hypothetical protein